MLFHTDALWLHPAAGPLDWQVRRGERWAVVGASGAGKTLLGQLLDGTRRAERGVLQWASPLPRVENVCFERQQALAEHDRRFDDSELRADARDPGIPLRRHILGDHPEDGRFAQLVEALRLAHVLARGIRFVSSGEARKALLARALLAHPDLLILDDPADSVDAASRARLPALLETYLGPDQALLWLSRDRWQLPPGTTHVLWLENGQPRYCGPRAGYLPPPAPPPRPALACLPGPLHPPPEGDERVRMAGLSLRYGDTPILRDIHWTLGAGRHALVSGPNGAGKSTLLSLISGDNHRGYGQPLWLFGRKRGSGESVWDIKRHVGLLSNDLHLNYVRGYSVLDVVASGGLDSIGVYQRIPDRVLQLARQWLEALSLSAWRDRRFSELGFGEQRLVLLARAVVKSPALLLLDEPTVGLEVGERRALLALVDRIADAGRTQVILTTHLAEELPACINQRVELVPVPEGGYTAVVTE